MGGERQSVVDHLQQGHAHCLQCMKSVSFVEKRALRMHEQYVPTAETGMPNHSDGMSMSLPEQEPVMHMSTHERSFWLG